MEASGRANTNDFVIRSGQELETLKCIFKVSDINLNSNTSMEEILVKVNYYVRERLWGQLKALCDYVSKSIMRGRRVLTMPIFLGDSKRSGRNPSFLEGLWNL